MIFVVKFSSKYQIMVVFNLEWRRHHLRKQEVSQLSGFFSFVCTAFSPVCGNSVVERVTSATEKQTFGAEKVARLQTHHVLICRKLIKGSGRWTKRRKGGVCPRHLWPPRLVFHQKTRRAEVKPLSPALCCCATHMRALFAVVSSANLLFSHSQHPGCGASQEADVAL